MVATIPLQEMFSSDRRALACGISCVGSSVGVVVISLLRPIIIAKYDWHKTLLIELGLVAINIPALIIMKVQDICSKQDSDGELILAYTMWHITVVDVFRLMISPSRKYID